MGDVGEEDRKLIGQTTSKIGHKRDTMSVSDWLKINRSGDS